LQLLDASLPHPKPLGHPHGSRVTLAKYYCQILSPYVCCQYVGFHPEERAALHLLYVLYACVFWRGEADLLEF
jgi:hypothetical protein